MTFQVYYRKWRPQRFSDLVSQEHVSSTLRQAVQQGRVAHSYLFCGPRGTGKTSTARILAKTVNCLSPKEGDPCNECAPCTALNEGRFMDLIELDAASNRGIDEIRNIREKVNLAPVEGKYKVYIIDEAHMLTEHASNAFLKTLEEPPPHAIFILCTTEPHKILPTIISRCQRFDFRRLTSEAIRERLRRISLEEGVDAKEEALTVLAHSAGGSLRDAENLLEQLVVSFGNRIGTQQVNDLLGLGQSEGALEFIRYLLMGNTAAALTSINRAAWEGVDLRQIHRQAVGLLRGVLMLQCGSRDSLDLPQDTVKELEELAPKASTARVMKALRLLGEVNMKFDAGSPLPLELAVVEVCLEETPAEAQAALAPLAQPPSQRQPVAETTAPSPTPRSTPSAPSTSGMGDEQRVAPAESARPTPVHQPAQPVEATELQSPASPPPQDIPQDGGVPVPTAGIGSQEEGGLSQERWSELVKSLSRYKGKRYNIGALLRGCKGQRIDGETLILSFVHRSHLERMQEELDDPLGMKTVSEAVQEWMGTPYQLRLVMAEDNGATGVPSTIQSPLVKAALSIGARIVEERE